MTPFKKLTSLNLAAATLATLLSLPQTAHAQYEAGSKKALPPSKKSEVEKPAPVKPQPQKPVLQKPAPQKPEPKKPVAQIPPKKGSPDFSDYTLKVGEKVYDRDTQSDVEITRILSDGTLYYKYLDGAYADTFKHQDLAEFRFAKDHKCLNGLSVGEKLYDTDTQSDVEITRILSDGTLYYKYLDGAYAHTFKHQELAEFHFAKDILAVVVGSPKGSFDPNQILKSASVPTDDCGKEIPKPEKYASNDKKPELETGFDSAPAKKSGTTGQAN